MSVSVGGHGPALKNKMTQDWSQHFLLNKHQAWQNKILFLALWFYICYINTWGQYSIITWGQYSNNTCDVTLVVNTSRYNKLCHGRCTVQTIEKYGVWI